jgi:hypothetical protein
MLMQRIMGAFTFKREVYAEVAKDTSFTTTAWGIVVGIQVINLIVGFLTAGLVTAAAVGAAGGDLGTAGAIAGGSIVSSLISLVLGVGGFALFAYVAMFVANSVFKATTTFDQMVRVLGLAYVWNIVGALNILLIISVFFVCVTGILGLAALVLWALSGAIGIKEVTNLDWTQTIVTVILATVAYWIISVVIGGILLAGFLVAAV